MTPISRLARMQQAVTLSTVLGAAIWVAAHLTQPLKAALGGAFILFFYAIVLALEFVLLAFVARGDATPRPSLTQVVGAWWAETLQVPRVFGWRQPFHWRQVEDQLGQGAQGRRGVVFIHGFVCNRGLWTPWLKRLQNEGRAFVAVNLEPVFGSIDGYAAAVDSAVQRVTDATGMPPVLICHSMGGLVARAWLRAPGSAQRVHHVVTIGTPHQGTWLARFSRTPNGRQMRIGGHWLAQLARDEADAPRPPFTCWYSNCDNIVFPPATATMPDADNRLVAGAAHVDLAFRPQVVEASLQALDSA